VSRVEACASRWGLRLGPRLPSGVNWVAEATDRDGHDVVLKLLDDPADAEAAALRLLDGRGAARLLDADEALGALLIERVRPGTPLDTADDERATRVLAELMPRLWRPVPRGHALPTVEGWGEGFARHRARFGGGAGPLDAGVFARGEAAFAELVASSAPRVVLHGDLHQDNVVRAEREPWLAIDPKGVIGEPAYEPGVWLHNPVPGLLDLDAPGRVLARRLDVLAETLELDRERLRAWGFAQAVLSAVWFVEDERDGWEFAIACARLLT
jgi:streptomycin 6-kinase